MKEHTEFRIFQFIGRLPRKFKLLFYSGLVVYSAKYAVTFLIPLAQRVFIDDAIANKQIWSGHAMLLLGLMAAGTVLLLAEYVGFRLLRIRLREYLYRESVSKVLALPKNTIQAKGSAYYTAIFTNLTQSLSTLVSPSIFDFFFGSVQMICVNIIVFNWCRPVFYLFLGAYLLTAISTYVFHILRKRLMDDINQSGANLSADSNEIVSNTFTLKTSANADYFTSPVWDLLLKNNCQTNSLLKALEINRFTFSAIKYATFFLMLVIILHKIIAAEMTYGQLLAIIAYFSSLFEPFSSYVTFLGDLTNYGSWVKRYEEAFPEKTGALPVSAPTSVRVDSVELQNVILPYGKKSRPLSFKIDCRLGITGLSGEGKSSILKMLYREVLPETGIVMINGSVPLPAIPAGVYYAAFNIIPQSVEIFNRNLHDNILLGKKLVADTHAVQVLAEIRETLAGMRIDAIRRIEDAPVSVRSFLKASGFTEMESSGKHGEFMKSIMNNQEQTAQVVFNSNYILKNEYERIISLLKLEKLSGRLLGVGGEYISGGERQRIALARFLLRKDYAFYVLDEPFASLDAHSEHVAVKLLQDATAGRKGILISHQFNTLEKLSDRILLIDDGIIVESGVPQKLIAENGQYHHLREIFYRNHSQAVPCGNK